MLKIRLSRKGRKNLPFYSIVVAESTSPRDGKFVDQIGYYDPLAEQNSVKIDLEKFNYWAACGAQPSERVAKLYKNYIK